MAGHQAACRHVVPCMDADLVQQCQVLAVRCIGPWALGEAFGACSSAAAVQTHTHIMKQYRLLRGPAHSMSIYVWRMHLKQQSMGARECFGAEVWMGSPALRSLLGVCLHSSSMQPACRPSSWLAIPVQLHGSNAHALVSIQM